jgi:hypothetical protein
MAEVRKNDAAGIMGALALSASTPVLQHKQPAYVSDTMNRLLALISAESV